MLPVMLLKIGAGHKCLDMCAAPGSKTAQMLAALAEGNFRSKGRGLESICGEEAGKCQRLLAGRIDYSQDEGCVVANEMSVERLGMLVHQIARHQSLYPLALFTSHDARFFPSVRIPAEEGGGESLFDRILCDVMCSGDGTLRKAPHLWREWHPKLSAELHSSQLAIALRAARLLKVGGRMVYSTCSMSPVENEAVVAEILRCTSGSLSLAEVRDSLQPLKCCEGQRKWKVPHPKSQNLYATLASAESEAPDARMLPGHFPPAEDSSVSAMLPRCIRILPHHNDTGGFFIAVFDKIADMPAAQDASSSVCPRAYDSDVDEDGEEVERRQQLVNLEKAVESGRSEQERLKAASRRERVRNSGSLSRELARYKLVADGMPEAAAVLKSCYGLHDSFPMDNIFCRYHLELSPEGIEYQPHEGEAHQLLMCARGIGDVIRWTTGPHVKRKLKILTGGLRAFEKDRFETGARTTKFRLGQEVVELLLPYLQERVTVLSDAADTERLLCDASKSAPLDALVSPEREMLKGYSPGGCVVLLRTVHGNNMAVSALRTQNALNVYISNDDLPGIKKACGLASPTDEEPAKAQAEDVVATAS